MWNSEARKLHTLLYWMATNRVGDSFVTELLLTWIAPESNSDKSQQLAAALVLFELIQRHRQRFFASRSGPVDQCEPPSASLLGSSSSDFVRHLIQLTRQGSIISAANSSTQRLKLTKLGLVALEALVAMLCDQAAWLSEASQSSLSSSSSPHIQTFQEGTDVAISTLQQYHTASSSRKKFLLLALNQLSEYTEICKAAVNYHTSNATDGAIEMLCWHWNASSMLLCTRSDAVLRIRKAKPVAALKTEILHWSANGSSSNPEALMARLRRLCTLLSFASGSRGSALLDELSRDLEAKGKLLLVLVRALKVSIQQKNHVLVEFVTKVLHSLVLHEEKHGTGNREARPKQLLETEEDCQALLSLLLRTYKSSIVYFGATSAAKERSSLRSLEHMIADIGVQSSEGSLLTELQRCLGSPDSTYMLVCAERIHDCELSGMSDTVECSFAL